MRSIAACRLLSASYRGTAVILNKAVMHATASSNIKRAIPNTIDTKVGYRVVATVIA